MSNSPPSGFFKALGIRPIADVLSETNRQVKNFREGKRLCLKSRWGSVNRMLLGGFYFGQTYLIAGASGHGKSYFINILLRDFTDKRINGSFPRPFKILHFGFEMAASAEILRRVSGITGKSYSDLLSIHRPLSDDEYTQVFSWLVQLKNEPIYFVEQPCSRFEIYHKIAEFKRAFPDHELVVSIDHMLLVNAEKGEDEIQSIAEISKLFIQIRKQFKTLNLLVGQLNDKIEDERRRNPGAGALHYPTKTDIHGSKQSYQAADVVMVIHRPELINLEYYGKHNFPTKNLLAVHTLKNRNGESGLTRLKQNFSAGTIEEWRDPEN